MRTVSKNKIQLKVSQINRHQQELRCIIVVFRTRLSIEREFHNR